jgi:6-phosphogluconate dehydrogenase
MIGLGRMGANIVRRLLTEGHEAVVYDRNTETVASLAKEGPTGSSDLKDFVSKLKKPRACWVMVPSGSITEAVITELAGLLEPGDTIIDGGNSNWKDDIRRARELKPKGIHYVDVGTSGGIWGVERGYCLMVGAEPEIFDRLEPIFKTLAPGHGNIPRTAGREGDYARSEEGYIHAGPVGSGHYVKMIHNGIEYGLMQAYAEGFDILKTAASARLPEEERLDINITEVAEVWRRGSVVTSWLLDLTAAALMEEGDLKSYSGYVDDSGEGRWTVQAAVAQAVPAEVLTSALYTRFRSRQDHTFAEKVLSAMRKGFGGHLEPKVPPPDVDK